MWLRIRLVLGVDGGVLARQMARFEFGAGGVMRNGRSWMPWLGHDNMIRDIAFAIANRGIEGLVNAVAPIPVQNARVTHHRAAALEHVAFNWFGIQRL